MPADYVLLLPRRPPRSLALLDLRLIISFLSFPIPSKDPELSPVGPGTIILPRIYQESQQLLCCLPPPLLYSSFPPGELLGWSLLFLVHENFWPFKGLEFAALEISIFYVSKSLLSYFLCKADNPAHCTAKCLRHTSYTINFYF